MHCPSCGQQQVSNETKFCNRCGLPLGVVAEVVSYGGYLPQLAELDKKNDTIWTRKNGIFFSLFWFIFWVPLMTSIMGGVFEIEILGAICALVGVFGAMMMFIFSLAFLKRPVKYFNPALYQNPAILPPPPPHGALPPQQTMPASSYAPPQPGDWRDTNDLQPTVTESTTRLLNNEEKRQ